MCKKIALFALLVLLGVVLPATSDEIFNEKDFTTLPGEYSVVLVTGISAIKLFNETKCYTIIDQEHKIVYFLKIKKDQDI